MPANSRWLAVYPLLLGLIVPELPAVEPKPAMRPIRTPNPSLQCTGKTGASDRAAGPRSSLRPGQTVSSSGRVIALWVAHLTGAVDALGEIAQHAAEFLGRHARGDWGEFGRCDDIELTANERLRGWEATDDSAKINKSNLLNGRDRVLSEYQTNRGRRLWVITRLDGADEMTVLLPEEY
jgi:hypothetical protein